MELVEFPAMRDLEKCHEVLEFLVRQLESHEGHLPVSLDKRNLPEPLATV